MIFDIKRDFFKNQTQKKPNQKKIQILWNKKTKYLIKII